MTVAPTPLTFGEFRLDPVSGQLYPRREPGAAHAQGFRAAALPGARSRAPGAQAGAARRRSGPASSSATPCSRRTIRDLRTALGDDSHAPRFIETAHRRGYRFIAPIVTARAAAPPRRRTCRAVSYAHSGNVNIAYQVIGAGPDATSSSSWAGCRTSSTSGTSRRSRGS